MTTYYVRKTGSDVADGQSAGAAWLTIDKAANTVAAGDSVYIGAGVYRELVTMDTSGSSGSQISYIADIDGSQTGDAGLVIVTGWDYDGQSYAATRILAWDQDGKTFITLRGLVLIGGSTGALYDNNTVAQTYEGCIFEDCVFVSGSNYYAVYLDFNAGTTPTGAGPIFRRCMVHGGMTLRFDGNESAQQNMKVTVENCVFAVVRSANGFYWDIVTAGTYGSGGVAINNCLFYSCYVGVNVDNGASTTYPVAVNNSTFVGYGTGISKATSSDGALTSDYNRFVAGSTLFLNVTQGSNDVVLAEPPLFGAILDLPLLRFLGWSPFLPWEPINLLDGTFVSGMSGDTSVAPAVDLYNSPRPMARGLSFALYYFDGSDAAASDPDGAWTNDGNAFDGNIANYATTTTAGAVDSNELKGEGTNAPASGGTIRLVEYRVNVTTTAGTLNWQVRTDGWDENLTGTPASNTGEGWANWQLMTAPAGGWTWGALQALEITFWGTSTPNVGVSRAELRVWFDSTNTDARGPVEPRSRGEKEVTTVRTGSNALRFDGAGYHDILIPVAAAATTITVYGRYDSNHSGDLPQLKVINIPGVADQTDTMAGAADTWEQLSCSLTPTAAGVARVRLISRDTSATGKVFFDDLVVS